jgi:cobalt-zinc-cadmium efflux system membrane fusion protein
MKYKLFYLFFYVLIACNSQSDAELENRMKPMLEEEEHGEEEVGLTTIQMEKIGLKLGSFEQRNLKASIKASGTIELPPQNIGDVSAIAAGKVKQILVKSGQYVKKGMQLAILQNPDFIEIQQEYLEVEGALLFINKEWERLRDLVGKGIAPQKKLDKISSERSIALAKLKGLESKLNLLGIKNPEHLSSQISLRSPMSGFVQEIKVNTGVYINPHQSLFKIVDNNHLHIEMKIFEKDLPYIKEGQEIIYNLQSQPSQSNVATIFAIGKTMESTEKFVKVHAEIEKVNANLLPGMFVEIRVLSTDKTVTSLPEKAVINDKGLPYIFVKEEVHGDETHFKKIPILKGIADMGFVEVKVLEQLPAQSEIVIQGAYFLMAQSKKGEEGAGHHH